MEGRRLGSAWLDAYTRSKINFFKKSIFLIFAFFIEFYSRDILLLDDPTSSLDALVGTKVLQNLRYSDFLRGRAAVIASGDPKVFEYCDKVILVDRGQIAFDGTPEDFLESTQAKEYFSGITPSKKVSNIKLTPPLLSSSPPAHLHYSLDCRRIPIDSQTQPRGNEKNSKLPAAMSQRGFLHFSQSDSVLFLLE